MSLGGGALVRMSSQEEGGPAGARHCGEGEGDREVTAVLHTSRPMTLAGQVSMTRRWGEPGVD